MTNVWNFAVGTSLSYRFRALFAAELVSGFARISERSSVFVGAS